VLAELFDRHAHALCPITPAQAELLRHAIDNHRRVKQLMREWEEQTERLIELEVPRQP